MSNNPPPYEYRGVPPYDYGAPSPMQGYPPMGGYMSPRIQQKNDGFAIASLVCSLVGLCVAGMILGILGIIFGAISIKRINERPYELKGKGMAIAGLIIGIFAFVAAIFILILFMGSSMGNYGV